MVASCGGRGSQSVGRVFLERVYVFLFYEIKKPLCYSVQIYKCMPGIYVITRVIFKFKEFIV